ncbi:MAG: 50S ribosomal protein L6 [Clostridia bacterium]|nr:50S ribosomal protein L6 [Clostridia bacterium]MBR2303237.1 50S ribosomal protein L6 [Clostridia bacterium]
MSRIGRMPIVLPEGVEVKVENGLVTVKGPKGQLSQQIGNKDISVAVENNTVVLSRANDKKDARAQHGLYRALINNMVVGVTKGFEKALIVNGVGYKAQVQGKKLILNIGYSHPVEIEAPEGITIECPQLTEVVVKGIDKTLVGQVAANIRAKREVEPYHSYGIRYKDEVVITKEGKTAGK